MSGRRQRPGRAFAPVLVAVLLSACAVRPVIEISRPPAAAIELSDTPFFPQTEHHCGPAALATVLGAQGLGASPEALAPWVYVPGREGSLRTEMLAAVRRFDRVPLRLSPDPQDLVAALQDGRPVLVLQNLAFARWPRWHYAVLVGYLPESRLFVLRSGTTERELLDERRFLRTWDLAGRWALVPARPDRIPAPADPQSWLAAAAPFESLQRVAVAARAYRAAVQRWPDSALPLQALANALYAQGDRAGAEVALQRAVQLDPQAAAARNNLANLLLERGCVAAARRQLEALSEQPPQFADAIDRTRRRIDAAPTRDDAASSARCPH